MGGDSPEVSYSPTYPGYHSALGSLGQQASSFAGQLGQPYGGQMVAGFSPAQQSAQNYLQNWMSSAQTPYTQYPMYQAAAQNLMDTVSGAYVQPNSPFTQGMSQYYMGQVYPRMQAQLNQQAAREGSLSSSGFERMSSDLASQGQDYLTSLGAQNYQTERANQLNSLTPAMNVAQQYQYAPAQMIQTLQGLGTYAQQQQQSELSAQYQDWQRARQEELQNLSQSYGLGAQQQATYNQGSGGAFSNYVAPALDIAALIGAPFTGGASLMAIPAINAASGMTSQGGAVSPWSQGIQTGSGIAGSILGTTPYGQGVPWNASNITGYGGGSYGYTTPTSGAGSYMSPSSYQSAYYTNPTSLASWGA